MQASRLIQKISFLTTFKCVWFCGMGQNLRGNKINLFEQMILVDFDMKISSLLPFSSQTMTLDTFWSRFTAKILFCWFWVSCITKSVSTEKMMGAKQGAVGIFGLLQLSEPHSSHELFVFYMTSVSNHF
jgi:hypothetical protein